jgi:hypothetical protein
MTWLFQAPSESISGIMVKPYRSEGVPFDGVTARHGSEGSFAQVFARLTPPLPTMICGGRTATSRSAGFPATRSLPFEAETLRQFSLPWIRKLQEG